MGRISKTKYLGVYAAAATAGVVCLIVGSIVSPVNSRAIIAGVVLMLGAKLTFLAFLLRAWRELARGKKFRPAMSPGRAVLPLLIPLYNFYWQFRAVGGLAAEFNRFAGGTGRGRAPVSESRARLLCLLALIPPAWPAIPFMAGAFIGEVCDAINVFAAGNLLIARETLPDVLIEVENLTRRYGRVTAVDDISFSVRNGEVIGFLGPNGAGKTTTMRIITGYLPATSGAARIGGYDVFRDSLAARRLIGYMPEGLAIYPEMRVVEYLKFRARVKGVPAWARPAAVARSMERCYIADVAWKLIGNLSKGYRQRVGLADALINDPPILILDEPSVGLDPNQIKQVRSMVRELGMDHTVLLSTHILPEVEAVCGRAILINQGRIALDMPVEARDGKAGVPLSLEALGPREQIIGALSRIPGVAKVRLDDSPEGTSSARLEIAQKPGADARAAIFAAMSQNGWPIIEITRKRNSLEEIFARYTIGDEPASEPVREDAP